MFHYQSLRDIEQIFWALRSWYSCILPSFHCELVQDERRLSPLLTQIIPISIHWPSSRVLVPLLRDSTFAAGSWRLFRRIDGDLHTVEFQPCPFDLIVITSHQFPGAPWTCTLTTPHQFLGAPKRIVILLPLLRMCCWVLVVVSHQFPGAPWSRTLIHQIHRSRLHHCRLLFSRTFLSSLRHDTLLSDSKKIAVGKHRDNLLCCRAFALDISLPQTCDLCDPQGEISQNFPDERIWITVRCSPKPVDVLRKNLLSENVPWFNLLLLGNNATRFPVLFGSWDELDIKFLLQSDKLVIAPHLLLSPASTRVKPAEHECAHRPNPIQEGASQCSQQFRQSELKTWSVEEQRFDT